MNIYSHLVIDATILCAALTITLVLRAKGNAARKEKEIKWFQKKTNKNLININYLKFAKFLFMEVLLVSEFSKFIDISLNVFIKKWHGCIP